MDIVASFKKAQELHSRSLSQQVARTSFGQSMLLLLEAWGQSDELKEGAGEVPAPDAAGVKQEATKQALQRTLLSGLDGMAFSQQQLVDLTLRLWRQDGQQYRPSAETVAWLR